MSDMSRKSTYSTEQADTTATPEQNGLVWSLSQKAAKLKSPMLLAVFGVACLCLLLSVIVPVNSIPPEFMPFPAAQDKSNHLAMFFTMTVLSRFCLRLNIIQLAILMLLVAAGSEFVQMWVPHRNSSWSDFQANVIGIGVGIVSVIIVNYLLQMIMKYYATGYPR